MFQQLQSRYLNAITLCLHTGFLLAVILEYRQFSSCDSWLPFAAASLLASLWAWVFNHKRLLAISEHATSQIAAAAQGYVELYGKTRAKLLTRSPLQGVECVWFRYWVYAKDNNGWWNLSDYKTSENVFELQDSTGICEVHPQNAEVIAMHKHEVIQNDHKYIEEVINAGKRVYVLGEIATITEESNKAMIHNETGRLLSDWKKSPAQLKHRFDRDGNGQIDAHEWEQARAQSRIEVLAKHGILNQKEMHKISAPTDGRLFLISGVSPQQLRNRYYFWTRLHLFLGSIAFLLFGYALGRTGLALW